MAFINNDTSEFSWLNQKEKQLQIPNAALPRANLSQNRDATWKAIDKALAIILSLAQPLVANREIENRNQ